MLSARSGLVLLLALAVAGCDAFRDGPPDPTPIRLTAQSSALIAQSNTFGVSLFARTAAEAEGNLMLSPLSATGALTMLLNGARGETYAQIRDLLGYAPGQDLAGVNAGYRSLREQLLKADPEVSLALANAVFYSRAFDRQAPFKPAFLSAMRDEFDASVTGLDFASPSAPATINRWASDHTNGRVPRIVGDQPDPTTVMLLLDALYFKGAWSEPFKPDATRPSPFRLDRGDTLQVPTMHGLVDGHIVRGDGYTALELPYGRRNFSLVALMPDAGALAGFPERLEAGLWRDATTRLGAQPEWEMVDVALPRFTFSFETSLRPQLRALGMTAAFGAADLSGISDAALSVTDVRQNTFVDVNEAGTEAAAVTSVVIAVSSRPSFYADRPFVFAIRERTTNTLLFIGQVVDPSRR